MISWGRIHKTYTINKKFEITNEGFKSDDIEDKGIPFVTVISFKGGK